MNRTVRELPLSGDASSRFLPWIICIMVYLAGLALGVAMFISHTGSQWRGGLSQTLTAQVMPPGDISNPGKQIREFDGRTESALRLLRASDIVLGATLVPEEKVRRLMEPWLGPGGTLPDLPLPRLIDVRLVPGANVDIKALARSLAEAVPGATLDHHGAWLARLLKMARTVEWVAFGVLAAISFAAIFMIVFATRTGMAIHQEVIEVLHLAGARDSYVASQFQTHALRAALKGGAVGGGGAVATLVLLQFMSRDIETALLPAFGLSALQWAAMAAPPAAAALIGGATARLTALRTLKGMP